MKTFLSLYNQVSVFDGNNNFLGEISGVLFDKDYEKITGFIYKKKFLSYDFFLLGDLITFKDIIVIKPNIDLSIKDKYYDIIGKVVKTRDLINIGKVEDIEFDLTFKLKNLIVGSFYNFSSIEIIDKTQIRIKKDIKKISKKNILSYEDNYIIIENNNYIKENKKTLENFSKIFINIPKPFYNINNKKYE